MNPISYSLPSDGVFSALYDLNCKYIFPEMEFERSWIFRVFKIFTSYRNYDDFTNDLEKMTPQIDEILLQESGLHDAGKIVLEDIIQFPEIFTLVTSSQDLEFLDNMKSIPLHVWRITHLFSKNIVKLETESYAKEMIELIFSQSRLDLIFDHPNISNIEYSNKLREYSIILAKEATISKAEVMIAIRNLIKSVNQFYISLPSYPHANWIIKFCSFDAWNETSFVHEVCSGFSEDRISDDIFSFFENIHYWRVDLAKTLYVYMQPESENKPDSESSADESHDWPLKQTEPPNTATKFNSTNNAPIDLNKMVWQYLEKTNITTSPYFLKLFDGIVGIGPDTPLVRSLIKLMFPYEKMLKDFADILDSRNETLVRLANSLVIAMMGKDLVSVASPYYSTLNQQAVSFLNGLHLEEVTFPLKIIDKDSVIRNRILINASLDVNQSLYAGVFFSNLHDTKVLPEKVEYHISMLPTFVPPTNKLWEKVGSFIPSSNSTVYRDYYYLFIMDYIEMHLMQLSGVPQSEINFHAAKKVVMFPYRKRYNRLDRKFMVFLLPLLFAVGWLFQVASFVRVTLYEKESKLSDGLEIMQVSKLDQFFAFLIPEFLVFSFVSLFMAFILLVFNVVYFGGFFYMLLASILLSFGTANYCLMFFKCFSSPNLASTFACVIFVASSIPIPILEWYAHIFSGYSQFPLCGMITFTFGKILCYILKFELLGIEINSKTLWEAVQPDVKDFSLGVYISILFFDCCFYFAVNMFLYIDKSDFSDYLVNLQIVSSIKSWFSVREDEVHLLDPYEEEEVENISDSNYLMEIEGVNVFYDNGFHALKNIDLTLSNNTTVALLGHNGAGKSTLIKVMCGTRKPSSGLIRINPRKTATFAQKYIGYCPQDDIVFGHLTVTENMYFYGTIKGMDIDQILEYTNSALAKMGILNKKHTIVQHLSGGMKRKLCLAIALMGDPFMVILDEPTAGVDPKSRREIWKLLMDMKAGKTVILCTHFMDEAEVLGEEILVMSSGEIIEQGSTTSIIQKHSSGYKLTLLKAPEFNSHVTMAYIRSKIPNVQKIYESDSELMVTLNGLYSRNVEDCKNFFKDLSEECEILAITSFGINDTTIEDVFMKLLGENEMLIKDEESENPAKNMLKSISDKDFELDLTDEETQECTDSDIWKALRNIAAIYWRRAVRTARDPKAISVQILLPICFMLLSTITTFIHPTFKSWPALEMKPQVLTRYCEQLLPVRVESQTELLNQFKSHYMTSIDSPHILGNVECNNIENKLYEMKQDLEHFKLLWLDKCNMEKYILDTETKYGHRRAVGLTFGVMRRKSAQMHPVPHIEIWGDESSIHSLPIFVNFVNNLALKTVNARSAVALKYINSSSFPTIFRGDNLKQEMQRQAISHVYTAFFIVVAFSFSSAYTASFYVHEKQTGFRHLQQISAVNRFVYFLANYVFDMTVHIFLCFANILVFLASRDWVFVSRNSIYPTSVVLILFGIPMNLLMYLVQWIYKDHKNTLIIVSGINIMVGISSLSSVCILDIFYDSVVAESRKLTLTLLFSVFPHFCLGRSLTELSINSMKKVISEIYGRYMTKDQLPIENVFSIWLLGKFILPMIILFVLSLTLILLLEKTRAFYVNQSHGAVLLSNVPVDQNEEIEREEQEVCTTENNNHYNLIVRNLHKIYSSLCFSKVHAVRGITFGVKPGECFGLLGINGAGKTTTFSMLTGTEKLTYGEISHEKKTLHGREIFGYCPQTDCVDALLTPDEHIEFFATLRGIPIHLVAQLKNKLIESFSMEHYRHRRTGTLSFGNRRKLSSLIATIGDPPIIFMDEPTSGMDPVSKRFLWEIIRLLIKSGTSVLLTSHSMEECQALCNRLAIMIDGQFKCLGSPQYLKDKYSKGYGLSVVSKSVEEMKAVRSNILTQFPNSIFMGYHGTTIKFSLNITCDQIHTIFDFMDKRMKKGIFERFSLSQNNLEQVFLNLANLNSSN